MALTGDGADFFGLGCLAADLLRLALVVLAGGMVFDLRGDLLGLDFLAGDALFLGTSAVLAGEADF